MTERTIVYMAILSLCLLAPTATAQPDTTDPWAVKADIVESCSCDPACPCMFGSAMTNETCEGSRLYEIQQGHFGGVDMAGLKVVVTFRVGQWVKYYVTEGATTEQMKAVAPLIASVSPVFDVKVLSIEKAPITVTRNNKTIRFSVPTSTVEIGLMEGMAGKTIKIADLPYQDLQNYVQYESVENSHRSEDIQFKYSDTNGFTSTVDAKKPDHK